MVRDLGGIDPKKAEIAGYPYQTFKEFGLISVLKKGGLSPDEIAEELANRGELVIPEGASPSDTLIEALKSKQKRRDFIEKHGYESLFVYKKFFEFLKKFSILILENKCSVDDFQSIMEKYKLLPNDALIAATCRHYGIKKVATFDEDFKRVDFLEVMKI